MCNFTKMDNQRELSNKDETAVNKSDNAGFQI